MTNQLISNSVWLRPDHTACYPTLEAAKRGLKQSPEDGDIVLWQYDVPAENVSKLSGLLTNEDGVILRSGPQRLLDGLSSIGASIAGLACAACLVPAAGSVVGLLFLAGPLMEATAECFGKAAESAVRAVRGQSGRATAFAQAKGQEFFGEDSRPKQYAHFTRQGEEWVIARQKDW